MFTSDGQNSLMPHIARITQMRDLADEIKFFQVAVEDNGDPTFSNYKPGQFAFLSAFGVGEAPFGFASTAERGTCLEFAVQRLGSVTTGLHELEVGDPVGVRGPLGNSFPMENFKGKNLLVIGGGIGGAPLRPVIHTILDHRDEYGHLTILWAARHPSLLVFKDEYDDWRAAPYTALYLTVDQPDKHWDHNVGLMTELLEKVDPSPFNTVAITCGPPIMLHFVNQLLDKLGFDAEQSYVTLEARMHCGIGKCGRCNLGEKLVCRDGPVFTFAETKNFLESYL